MQNNELQNLNKYQLIAEINSLRQKLADMESAFAGQQAELDAVLASEAKYRVLLDNSSDPIFMFGRDGQYIYVNQAFAEGVEKPPEEIIGNKIWDVFSKDEADRRYAVVRWVFENGQTRVIEVRVPRSDGDRYYITTAKPNINELGQTVSVICISKDITERKHAEDELVYLSNHDVLTGLYNRAFLESELTRLQTSRLFPISIIVVDMDNLKQTNDQQGHPAGDNLIRHTAQILRQSFRSEDIIARSGGDEFVVLLPETDRATAEEAVQRLRDNLSNQPNSQLHLSIGIATGIAKENLHTILRDADDNMYLEKALHRQQAITNRS